MAHIAGPAAWARAMPARLLQPGRQAEAALTLPTPGTTRKSVSMYSSISEVMTWQGEEERQGDGQPLREQCPKYERNGGCNPSPSHAEAGNGAQELEKGCGSEA